MPIILTLKERPIEYRKMILTSIDFKGEDLPNVGALGAESIATTGDVEVGGDLEVTGDVKGAALEVGGATGIDVILNDGAPNGSVLAKANSLCVDTTGHDVYINTGSAETPVWMKITRATE